MKSVVATVLFSISILSFAADPVPEELTAYQEKYAQLCAQLAEVRDEAVTKAIETYAAELTTLLANVRKQGDLDYVVAVKTELKRLETDPTAPTEPAPKRMTHLRRAQWGARQAEDKALGEFESSAAKLLKSYTISLGNLEKQLVAANRIAEAKLVREKREAIADGEEPAKIRITEATKYYQLSTISKGSITKLDSRGNLVIHQFPDRFAGWGVTTCKGGKGISYTFRVRTPGRVYIAANSEVKTLVPKLGWDKEDEVFRLGTGKPSLSYVVFSKKFGVGEGTTPEIMKGEAYPLLLVPPIAAGSVAEQTDLGNVARLRIQGGSGEVGPLENKKTVRTDRGDVRFDHVSPILAGWNVVLHTDRVEREKAEALSSGWAYVAYSALDYNEAQWPDWAVFGEPFWLSCRYPTPFVILRKQVTRGPVELPSPRQWWPLILLPPGAKE